MSTLDGKSHLLGRNKDVSCHFLWTSDQQTLLESEGAGVLDSLNSAGGLIQGAVFPLYEGLNVWQMEAGRTAAPPTDDKEPLTVNSSTSADH